MNLYRLIKRVEKYLGRDLEFSMREFKQLQDLRQDIDKMEQLLHTASGNSATLIEHYKSKSKHDLRYVERIERRLNVWIRRLEKLVTKQEGVIAPRDRQYFELFKQRTDVCKNNLVRILAWGGELHQMINKTTVPPDTKKIKEKIDEAFGDDRRPGLRSLIGLLKQMLQESEQRVKQWQLEEYTQIKQKKLNEDIRKGDVMLDRVFDEKSRKRLDEVSNLRRILAEREESQNRIAKEKVQICCSLISTRFGLGVARENFPGAYVSDKLLAPAQYEGMAVASGANLIGFKSVYYTNDGTAIGEEIGHFFREFLRPKDDNYEILTHEFFGFLGRRMLYEASPSLFKSRPSLYFGRLDVLAARRGDNQFRRKQRELKLFSGFLGGDRKSGLEHYRGYDFASRLDLSKIHNWRKLFSMPNREVRIRFFRVDQNYSDL
jgi:hypothetical protein